MNLPHYIQKAVDLGLLEVTEGKITGCNKDAVETVFGAARLVEKLQPTTTAKLDDTTDQEAIVLCRILSSPSGRAREYWSDLRVAFGIGHGQSLPMNLWSTRVFRAIGNEIDRTFLGERDSAIISRESLITQYANLAPASQTVSTIEFNKTVSELGAADAMSAYGDAQSEFGTALDILRQQRVRALYKETLSMADQVGRTDSKLEKNIEFLQSRSMECLGMLRGSIGQQGNFGDLVDNLLGTDGRAGFMDGMMNAQASERPISTGILALDIDMEGGIYPPSSISTGGRLFTLAARTGAGKCLKIDTPIIMADGSTRPVQDVREGDLVLGPDGTPRRVYGLARGRSEMYRVTPVKGDSYVVNDAHILSLRVTGGQKNTLVVNGVRYRGGDIVNIEVIDYLKLSQTAKHKLKGWRSDAVDFHGAPAYDGPLTPYLAGVYLGDGHRHACRLTLSDQEVADELKSFCLSAGYNLHIREGRGCCDYLASTERGKDNPIWSWINDCRFKDEGKYIPEPLKRGSVQQRLEVLAGVIDTDGHLDKGNYDLVLKERRFADDVAFVARSLGLAAYVAKCQKGIKSLNFTGDYYRIFISGDIDRIPCRVQRKKAQSRQQIKNVLNTGIKVESIGVDDYYGFAVEGDDKLFLLGDFTVTHNTQIGVQVVAQAAYSGLTVGFISAELDQASISARLWASLTKKSDGQGVFSGKLTAPPESEKGQIGEALMHAAGKIQANGGRLLVEAPWGADVDTVVSTMRSMKAKHPELRLVVLDHFHCLSRHKGAPSNESAMMEERAYKLMTAAKELDIDLIALAQMNRVGMDIVSSKHAPGLDQIRGTDALAHVSHAVWIIRSEQAAEDGGGQYKTGNLELWHAKTRGRQAYWDEATQSVQGIRGHIEKSVISINHPTSSIASDDTRSLLHS